MGKKQGRNQSSSLPTYFLSSKQCSKTENNSHQKRREISHRPINVQETPLPHTRINQLSSNPFQFVKNRAEDGPATSLSFSRAVVGATNTNSVCQYHYYQTNHNRWMNQNEYKHHNINCWLDNVLKNNQNNSGENEDFESEEQNRIDNDEDDVCLGDDSTSCSAFRTKQRYKPYGACVKRELPIDDQNETSYRQDKIKTLRALIARHDERLNGTKRFQNVETNEQNQNGVSKKTRSERGKNCQLHQNIKMKTSYKSTKEKKTAFDIRKPNSIFFAVLEEEHLGDQQNTSKTHLPRRRKGRSTGLEGKSWSCCRTETLCERHEEFLSHGVELEHISA